MHAKDRIVTDSDQHWVLFALKKYEDITGNRGVSPSALHTELGEKLPSADYLNQGERPAVNGGPLSLIQVAVTSR